MDRLLFLLPVLVCPAAMGLMIWLMMRGGHRAESPTSAPLDAGERAELDQLRAARGTSAEDRART
jgi:hypothetical protein